MIGDRELWDLYTAREEYNPLVTDKYGRFPHYLSQNRNVFQPQVSTYLVRNGLKPKYPDNKKFAVCLTHDVDLLYYDYIKSLNVYMQEGVKGVLRGKPATIESLKQQRRESRGRSVIRRINANWHINKLLEAEKAHNVRSSFYFLSLTKPEQDFNYSPSEIKEIFEEVKYNKCEIGLHGGHLAYNDLSKTKEERERLQLASGIEIQSYRNHYLRFKTPLTWKYLNQLGFKYDTTFGYADCAGFRNGMCYPFQPFDILEDKFLNIIELPLVVMEKTLSDYMGLNTVEQFKVFKNLIENTEQHNGVLTLLWHNHVMDGESGEQYKAFLKYAVERNAWIATANEIVDWWKENNYLSETRSILEGLRASAV
ncbi:MAG TPA: polysaccharide deacetylase family protein [Bacteroidia bacterium]|jgi:hypothetical protein|nr:polysaccharide deacetylase family protein [Bacteroidia bacterium]